MSSRTFLLFTLLIISAVLLETSVLPLFVVNQFKPDLLLIIVVYLALRSNFKVGSPVAWLLGLVKDVFSGLYLGLNAFSFLIIFLLIKSVADRLYAESDFLFVLTVTAASFGCMTLNLFLLYMFTQTPGMVFTMAGGLVPHLVVNAFAASLVNLLPRYDRPQEVL